MNNSVYLELKSLGVKLPKLKKLKSSIPKQPTKTASSLNKIFGVYLSELEFITIEDYTVPKFIFTSTSYLKKYSKKEIGLFRKAGSVLRQKELRARLESGGSIEGSEPNDVASLLKQWLRELPESLIPAYLHDLMIRCQNLKHEENRISAVLLCCHLLPHEHLHTLKYLLEFLADIASNSDVNKMGAQNLALIMAPNIFVMGTESIDKSSNNLMQMHSAVVELLINNVQRMTIKCPIFILNSAESEAQKSGNELDMSIDALDYSPSMSKKKRRSGPVQDLFTGIKKLVGQNSTSPSFSKWWSQDDGPSSASRSAPKRKADPEQLSMSPLKKQATASNNLLVAGNVNSTPKSGHSRRKSFGLLRRKDKKKRKAKVETTICMTSPVPVENPVTSLQEKDQGRSSPLLSEFDIDKIMSKTTFTEKCVSESHLSNQDNLVGNRLFSPYSSEGYLHIAGRRYNLRSDCETNKENICLKISPNLRSSPQSQGIVPKQDITNSAKDIIPKVFDLNDSVDAGLMLKRNLSSIRMKNRNLRDSNSSLVKKTKILPIEKCTDIKANKGETNINFQNFSPNIKSQSSNKLCEEKENVPIKRKCTIKRQEAFSVKAQRNKKENSTNRSDSVKNVSLEANENSTKVQDPNNDDLRPSDEKEVFNSLPNTPDTRHLKRTVRNASIVRGRPNSLKSGLPADLSNGYGSKTKFNVKHRARTSTTSVDNHIVTDFVKESEKTDPSLSITLQIQNIRLTSPSEDNTPEAKNKIQNSQFKRKAFLDVELKRVTSKKRSYKMISSNSDSKVHKMKTRSSKVIRVHSFPEPAMRKSKMIKPTPARSHSAKKSKDKKKREISNERDVKDSKDKENTVLPQITIDTPKDIFKTPRANYETPEVWYSGREFLEAERSQQGDVSNKRESIAMIRKNKKGHVLEKINMFDSNPSSDTPSQLHSKVARTASLYNPVCKQMVTMPQKCSSSVKSNKSARNRYSPLPPPPKFVIPDSPPKQSFPLKVLFDANVSNSDTFLSPSPSKTPFTSTLNDSSVEKSLKSCSLKPKRNSYSGHTPYKLPKKSNKVFRSESSPMISNLDKRTNRIALNM